MPQGLAIAVIGAGMAGRAHAAAYRSASTLYKPALLEERTNLGGHEFANQWPEDSAWDFVALGRGHDQEFWNAFVAALYTVDPDMAVNIEHEDVSLGRVEGIQVAAQVLLDAAAANHHPADA